MQDDAGGVDDGLQQALARSRHRLVGKGPGRGRIAAGDGGRHRDPGGVHPERMRQPAAGQFRSQPVH